MNQQELDLVIKYMVSVEEAMLDLRKVIATGSMLKGWTPRKPEDITKSHVVNIFARAWCAGEAIENQLGENRE